MASKALKDHRLSEDKGLAMAELNKFVSDSCDYLVCESSAKIVSHPLVSVDNRVPGVQDLHPGSAVPPTS